MCSIITFHRKVFEKTVSRYTDAEVAHIALLLDFLSLQPHSVETPLQEPVNEMREAFLLESAKRLSVRSRVPAGHERQTLVGAMPVQLEDLI